MWYVARVTCLVLINCLSHQVKQGTKCLPPTIVWLNSMYSVLFANELSTLPAPRIRPPMKTMTLAENRRLRAFERGPATRSKACNVICLGTTLIYQIVDVASSHWLTAILRTVPHSYYPPKLTNRNIYFHCRLSLMLTVDSARSHE